MIEIETKTKVVKTTLDLVSVLVTDAKLEAGPQSVSIRAIDPAHVAMLSVTAQAGAFEKFTGASPDSEVEIGLPLDRLKSAMKSSGPNVHISYDPDDGRIVVKSNRLTRSMSAISTRHIASPNIPPLTKDGAMVGIHAGDIQNVLRASADVSDHIRMTAGEDGFTVACEEDIDAVRMVIPIDDLTRADKCEGQSSMYPLDYLREIIRPLPADTVISVNLNEDYPLNLRFSLEEGVDFAYLLAPRIESD